MNNQNHNPDDSFPDFDWLYIGCTKNLFLIFRQNGFKRMQNKNYNHKKFQTYHFFSQLLLGEKLCISTEIRNLIQYIVCFKINKIKNFN